MGYRDNEKAEICTTLCIQEKPKEYQKIFFGDYGNFQRIDRVQYDVFRNLAKNSENNSWFPNEIDYSRDRKGWAELDEDEKRMFHLNILYQTVLDSLVPNSFGVLSMIASDTWLSYLYSRINTEENIHSLTYSEGLMRVFGAGATELLDHLYDDDVLKNRMKNEIRDATEFVDLVFQKRVDERLKRALLKTLIRTYFLEGVRFPSSFAMTWSINKHRNSAISGFSQALKLILWDELTVHTVTGTNVLKILMRDKEQGFDGLRGFYEDSLFEIAEEVAKQEIAWAEYLMPQGHCAGITVEMMEMFIKYITDLRLKHLKQNGIFHVKEPELFRWFEEYRDLNKTQVMAQESDTLNYKKGVLVNDLDQFDNHK